MCWNKRIFHEYETIKDEAKNFFFQWCLWGHYFHLSYLLYTHKKIIWYVVFILRIFRLIRLRSKTAKQFVDFHVRLLLVFALNLFFLPCSRTFYTATMLRVIFFFINRTISATWNDDGTSAIKEKYVCDHWKSLCAWIQCGRHNYKNWQTFYFISLFIFFRCRHIFLFFIFCYMCDL